MAKTSKLNDRSLLNNLRDVVTVPPTNVAARDGDTFNATPSYSGLFQNATVEPKRNFIVGANNLLLTDSTQNAAIVIGSDRPSGIHSGYGGKGAQGANTIDMVVGRMASNPKLPDMTAVQNAFSGDAARIYISQLTDIDVNFGIDDGFAGNIKGRSGIGIKADAVRIMGRQGVKIVSGRAFAFKGHGLQGEQNSRGGAIYQPAPPIELIAGNVKEETSLLGMVGLEPKKRVLQGVGKGENIRDAFRDLGEIVDEIWSAVFLLSIINTSYFAALGATSMNPLQTTAFLAASSNIGAFVLPAIHHTRVNKVLWDVNYTQPFGDKFVASKNVYAT